MRGITHLAIGLLSAAGAVALRPDLTHYSLTGVAVAGLASLAPDLDEPGSRLGRGLAIAPKYLRVALITLGLTIGGWGWYRLDVTRTTREQLLLAGIGLGILGGAFSEKTGRRLMLALTGVFVVAGGIWLQLFWLTLLGAFVVVSPFLAHRTFTHTIWATALWAYIAHGAAASWRDPGVFWLGTLGYVSHLMADSLTRAGVKYFYPFWGRAFGLPLIRTGSRGGNRFEALLTAGLAGVVVALWLGRLSK